MYENVIQPQLTSKLVNNDWRLKKITTSINITK
jgi:hypothetical protein